MSTKRTHLGWELRESGPADAVHLVLLLPGGMCSGEFYEDIMAEPKLASLRLVAATVPGFAGTSPPEDVSMENYAVLAGKLATDLGADVMVGHSVGANIVLEMAAAGTFSGPIVLLSPTFSVEDEAKFLDVLDRIGRVPLLGPAAWWLAMKGMPGMVKKAAPEDRRDALATDLAKNSASSCRRIVRPYFQYLRRHGELVSRLCKSGVKAWVVRGDDDEIGLKDEERRGLEACPTVFMVAIPGATHMALVEKPAACADVILDAVAAA